MEALVASWRRSGLTQAAFARREGINYTTFCSRVQQSRPECQSTSTAKVRFAEVDVTTAASTPGLEVRLADGVVVRGANVRDVAASLQQSIQALHRCG